MSQDPTPRPADPVTARDALSVALHGDIARCYADDHRYDMALCEPMAAAILAALPDGWTLARAEAGVSDWWLNVLADHEGHALRVMEEVEGSDDLGPGRPATMVCETCATDRGDLIVEPPRAEAGVSVEALVEALDRTARSYHNIRVAGHVWPFEECDAGICWDARAALAARSAGSGSRVEVTAEDMHGHPDECSCPACDYVPARPTPPPAVDGTRELKCSCGAVAFIHGHLLDCPFHPFNREARATPPTPTPDDRLRALEAALRRLLHWRDHPTHTGACQSDEPWNAARALLADGPDGAGMEVEG